MGTATRQRKTEPPAPQVAAAREPGAAPAAVDVIEHLAASPRLTAQRALHDGIAHSPRAARQRQLLQPLGLAPPGAQPAGVAQRWPMPSVSNILLLGGGLVVTASAPAWTSVLAVGGGLAMVVAVVREGAQAFGATQEPRDEDLDTPDETLDERSRGSQAKLEEASKLLSAAKEPAEREQAEQLATTSVLKLAEVEAVKISKKKNKKKKKAKPEETVEPDEEPDKGKQEAEPEEMATGDDEGWSTGSKKKPRGPKKSKLEKVQASFEQALRLTADRDRPARGRNNGGEVQGFSGLEAGGVEWRWLKDNVEGREYANHGMVLSPNQSLRWYVTASSNSGAAFDVSLHLYDGATDSLLTCLVLHVAK